MHCVARRRSWQGAAPAAAPVQHQLGPRAHVCDGLHIDRHAKAIQQLWPQLALLHAQTHTATPSAHKAQRAPLVSGTPAPPTEQTASCCRSELPARPTGLKLCRQGRLSSSLLRCCFPNNWQVPAHRRLTLCCCLLAPSQTLSPALQTRKSLIAQHGAHCSSPCALLSPSQKNAPAGCRCRS